VSEVFLINGVEFVLTKIALLKSSRRLIFIPQEYAVLICKSSSTGLTEVFSCILKSLVKFLKTLVTVNLHEELGSEL
jgi:phosphoserine aminotransferase